MHEAKTRLSELVKAVEERNETVVVCRDGRTSPKSGAASDLGRQHPEVRGCRHALVISGDGRTGCADLAKPAALVTWPRQSGKAR
jgi:hypothetical protein